MFGKVLTKAAIIFGHWTTLYFGYTVGIAAAKRKNELEELKRENKELKEQLISKKGS